MSDLVVRYSFETTEINGTILSNSAYGGKILNATLSASGMVSSTVYLVGTQSLALSGTNFVSLPSITGLGNALTISVWVYPTTATGTHRVVELAASATLIYSISYTNSNTFVFGVGANSYTFPNQTFPLNQWTHVCWVISPTTWRILINNMPATATLANTSATFPGTVLGASSFLGKSGGGNAFVGFLDDFRLYQIALTDDQIYEIYDTATYSSYYRFETGDVVSVTAPSTNTIATTPFASYKPNMLGLALTADETRAVVAGAFTGTSGMYFATYTTSWSTFNPTLSTTTATGGYFTSVSLTDDGSRAVLTI